VSSSYVVIVVVVTVVDVVVVSWWSSIAVVERRRRCIYGRFCHRASSFVVDRVNVSIDCFWYWNLPRPFNKRKCYNYLISEALAQQHSDNL